MLTTLVEPNLASNDTDDADGVSAGAFRPVVVAPSYNNAGTLRDVLDRLDRINIPVIVVNDGSTDGTAEELEQWVASGARGRTVVIHPENWGKGAALRSGFAKAAQLGFTHAVTIDTDGQLAPEDITALMQGARRMPDALLLGVRDSHQAMYPARSLIGRYVSNGLIWLETGVCVSDSQCGLRVYPLQRVEAAKCVTGYFGFETEIITRAAWAGVPIAEQNVSCVYLPRGERVSHFRPWMDSLRAVRLHARLLSSAATTVRGGARKSIWWRLARWLSPAAAWEQARGDASQRTRLAAGFAAGVLIATLPLYGAQTLLSLVVARRWRLNPLSVVVGSNASMPPLGALLVAGAMALGHMLLHGSLPTPQDFQPSGGSVHTLTTVVWPRLGEWLIGSAVLGVTLAGLTFVCLERLLRLAAAEPTS